MWLEPRLPLFGIDGYAPPLEGLAGYVKPVQEDVLGHDIAHDGRLLEVGTERVDLLFQFVEDFACRPRGCGFARSLRSSSGVSSIFVLF